MDSLGSPWVGQDEGGMRRSIGKQAARAIGAAIAAIAAVATGLSLAASARADEQLFAFTRGAETLPQGRSEAYQFVTLRTGKKSGTYYGLDFDTELEHGFTDRLQASLALVNRYFSIEDVEELPDTDAYRFGGVESSAKYRILSPFKDPVGLAFRLEGGYLRHDEVGGLNENEWFIAPEIDLQKNFRDDTINLDMNLGSEWAWGKQPAEQYPRELSLQGATGIAYRFASNWFIGAETRVRSEFPLFDLSNFEHTVVYAGPSLHYGAQRWWATVSWLYQVYGKGVDEDNPGITFAEETRQMVRLKFGWNF